VVVVVVMVRWWWWLGNRLVLLCQAHELSDTFWRTLAIFTSIPYSGALVVNEKTETPHHFPSYTEPSVNTKQNLRKWEENDWCGKN
jgi:hypothetical protein